ncbi:hypothetical protein CKW48_21760, partial [Bordetella pertussis]
ARARVLRLTDGEGMGWRGILRGRKFVAGGVLLLELVEARARVLRLTDGEGMGWRGILRGRKFVAGGVLL